MQTTTHAKRFLEGKLHRIIEVVNDPPFVVFRKAVVYLCFRQENVVEGEVFEALVFLLVSVDRCTYAHVAAIGLGVVAGDD